MRAAFAFAAVLLLACNKLERGTVIAKHIEPERDFIMMMPMPMGKTTAFIPYFIHDNEDFVVTITGDYKGNVRVENVYVSRRQFDCVQEGSELVLDKDCSLTDDNNTKTEQ